MFRFFVAFANTTMQDLSELHPIILESLIERAWNARINDATDPLGHPDHRSDIFGRPPELLVPFIPQAGTPAPFAVPRIPPRTGNIDVLALAQRIETFRAQLRWHHLIYAYMIENTRMLDVFRRVIDTFVHGERLGTLSAASQRWLWTTEELFYKDPPPFSQTTQTSWIRPVPAATRANAYQRLFGMTLNTTDAAKQPFQAAEHANADFVTVFDEILFELWQGRANFANQVGAKPTDDAKIAERITRLSEMLLARRANGTLSREEFWAITTMSWFHETLDTKTHPLMIDLRADAPSPEERLFQIAQRVGYPAHGLAKSYFELAEPMSRILIDIEQGLFNNADAVPALYTPTVAPDPPGPSVDVDTIITHWSIIRGRDVKAKRVAAA
jgi:hypothetical protein